MNAASIADRHQPPALLDAHEAVGRQVLKTLSLPRRPGHFDPIDAFCATQTEVAAEHALGKVTRPTSHPIRLHRVPCLDTQLDADPADVRRGPAGGRSTATHL